MSERTIALKLIEMNADVPDDYTCTGVTCGTISCGECPLDADASIGTTLGDLRKQYNSAPAAEEEPLASDDGVRQPSHYQVFPGLESIEVIARSMTEAEFRGFCMGNTLKYRMRAGKKSDLASIEKDLAKADFYKELFAQHKGKCYVAE